MTYEQIIKFAEMPIMITFESNWKKALSILERILDEVAGKENVEAAKQIRKASRCMRLFFAHIEGKLD